MSEELTPEARAYLSSIGRKGGQTITYKRQCSARRNGKKGGRPVGSTKKKLDESK